MTSTLPALPDGPLRLTSPGHIGPVIRTRRKKQALRIDDAAALLGVSADLMSRLENGQGTVRLSSLFSVLHGLGLELVVAPKNHPCFRDVAASTGVATRPSRPARPKLATRAEREGSE